MWILLALLAALTSGVSVIFQKKGTAGDHIFHISALNTSAMFGTVFFWALCSRAFDDLPQMTDSCWRLTIASGIIQAASWLTYFLAIKDAQVNFLMVLDKFNIVVTMVLAYFFVGEEITPVMMAASLCILGGTVIMAEPGADIKKAPDKSNSWVLWGILSPSLQAVSNILAKLDVTPVDTTLTTTIRMFVVAAALITVAVLKDGSPRNLLELGAKRLMMLLCGGIVLGISYLLMYRAIYWGVAAVVTPIVKANILVTTLLAYIFLHERLSRKGAAGFILVCVGVALFLI